MTVLRRVILRGTVVFLYNDVTIRDSIARTANEYVYTLLRRSLPQGAAVYRTDSENEYSRGNTLFSEQRKLGECVAFLDTMRKPLKESEREKGIYPYYGASGIVDYVSDYIFDEELVLLSEDGANITDRNYPVCFLASGKYWVNNHAHVLKVNTENENNFICNSLERMDFTQYNSGMAMPKLNKDVCHNIPFFCPVYEEQKQIGDFFRHLDSLITLHQRKCDALQRFKKSMLQKMFPQDGESVPEIRFAGFTDSWEQRKLGDVIEESYNGQTPSRAKDEYWNGSINWLASGDLNRGIVTHTTEKITDKGLEDTRLRIIPKGTFVMAITGLEAAGTRGNCGILGIDTALNQSCMALFPKDNILDTKFMFQWYCKVGEEYGINYTQGTKQQSYNAELIQILPISFPNIAEQQKIANYFSQLDALITLHQRKLETLQKMKKALLQKMFV